MRTAKILFLHGFFASGSCIPAQALKQAFAGKAEVLTPDLPLHPHETLAFITNLCEREHPNVLVGNSNGSFLERIGAHEYKSPRADGRQHFVIDQPLIDEFADIQAHQWDNWRSEMTDRIWGLFGENDHLAHFEPLFLQHYAHAYHFPGAHTPTAEEVQEYYVPLVERLMQQLYNKQICQKQN